MMIWRIIFFMILCTVPTFASHHRVKGDETLLSIAKTYGVTIKDLIQSNDLSPPYKLKEGQTLIIKKNGPMGTLQTHVVKPGETLKTIAQKNNMTPERLVAINRLSKPYQIHVGQRLRLTDTPIQKPIPLPVKEPLPMVAKPKPEIKTKPFEKPQPPKIEKKQPPVKPLTLAPEVANNGEDDPQTVAEDNTLSSVEKKKESFKEIETKEPAPFEPNNVKAEAQVESAPEESAPVLAQKTAPIDTGEKVTFAWPLRGKLLSTVGVKNNGNVNDGINVSAKKGTPIKSAAHGTVACVRKGTKVFGNLVLVRHAQGFMTAYTHCDQVFVKEGQVVQRGEKIASVGSSGEASTPQLHFEIRSKSRSVDPLKYLK